MDERKILDIFCFCGIVAVGLLRHLGKLGIIWGFLAAAVLGLIFVSNHPTIGSICFGLLYMILPIDAVPDTTPVVGWLDDVVIGLGSFVAGCLYAVAGGVSGAAGKLWDKLKSRSGRKKPSGGEKCEASKPVVPY